MQTGDHGVWQESGPGRLCITSALAFLLFFIGSWEGNFVLVSHSTVSHESLVCWRLDEAWAFKNDVFLLAAPPSLENGPGSCYCGVNILFSESQSPPQLLSYLKSFHHFHHTQYDVTVTYCFKDRYPDNKPW